METHGLVELYSLKAVEYLIAVAYLVLFVPFWRYVQGRAPQPAAVRVARAAWSELPDGVAVHPGHAWAARTDGVVTVGLDDFAHHLVGPLTAVTLPPPGSEVRQGRPAFALHVEGRALPVLAPVDGTVTERNADALERPGALASDPYGRGWLLKVRPRESSASFKQLLAGRAARAYLESCVAGLAPAAADGGLPVHGLARELDPEGWTGLARRALLSE